MRILPKKKKKVLATLATTAVALSFHTIQAEEVVNSTGTNDVNTTVEVNVPDVPPSPVPLPKDRMMNWEECAREGYYMTDYDCDECDETDENDMPERYKQICNDCCGEEPEPYPLFSGVLFRTCT